VRLRWEQGDISEMVRGTDDLIALIDIVDDDDERGKAMAAVAQSFMLREISSEAIVWADRAIEHANEHDLPDVRVWAEVEKGSALIAIPEFADTGDQMLRRAADEAEQLGEFVVVARALNNSVRSENFRPDTCDARDVLARMRAAADRAGFDCLAGAGYWQALAGLAEWDGDLEGALEFIDEGHRLDRGNIQAHHASWFQVQEAGLSLEGGDVERAERLFEMLTPQDGMKAQWWYGLALHIAARRGDLATVRMRWGQVLDTLSISTVDGQLLHDVLTPLLASGIDLGEARPMLDHASGPWLALLEGQFAEAEGRLSDAVERYDEAIATGGEILRPAALGTANINAARCLIALGDLDGARAHASHASEFLAKWGGWRVDELHAVQRRLGMGPGVEGPEALTPREREVVELLAEGLTNAELAARLYISPKTAAVHVSNILAKLGMASRSEVAAFAVREGLGGAATSRQ
jgi:DNA-binding CsgD family transcriptional regulator